MTYHLWTIGCQMNEADARHLAAGLEARGHAPAARAEEAELLILNTCVVRQQAEDRIYGRLRYAKTLKAQRPGRLVALMGCLVGTGDTSRLEKRFDFVDVFLPPSDPSALFALLEGRDEAALRSADEEQRMLREAIQNASYHLPSTHRDAVTAQVPAVLGCSHTCAYCIIPYRRGREHSRPAGDLLAEVRQLVAEGVREVTLLGQIVDRYGRDLPEPTSLAELLRAVCAVDGLRRVRFLTSHPRYFTDELLDAVAELDPVCPHIELPCQAGNDAVLAAMQRGYTVDEYRRLVAHIRERLPGAAVHTDVIVGFPGETEAAFEDTLRLMAELRFDKAHLAKYSVRPQTYAARHLPDDVPPEEKERRRKALDDLQAEVLREKNAALLGRTVPVLVEERDARSGRWRGRTPRDKLVFFEDPRDRRGEVADVRLTWTGPYSLIGEPVRATRPS